MGIKASWVTTRRGSTCCMNPVISSSELAGFTGIWTAPTSMSAEPAEEVAGRVLRSDDHPVRSAHAGGAEPARRPLDELQGLAVGSLGPVLGEKPRLVRYFPGSLAKKQGNRSFHGDFLSSDHHNRSPDANHPRDPRCRGWSRSASCEGRQLH